MWYRLRAVGLILAGGLFLAFILGGLPVSPAQTAQAQLIPLQFKNKGGEALAQATLRLVCYPTAESPEPVADVWRETDNQGQLTQPLPPGCYYLAALQLLHEQASPKPHHGPIYRVYATSWAPGSRNLVPAQGVVTITDEWPLVLFHLLVSLEWQPAASNPFIDQLWAGLQEASTYLYDLTEGQMAFGLVTLYTDGRYWNEADLRFRAANDYRPTAYVGGMVPQPLAYTTPLGYKTVYAPGAIYVGRFWDGQDAFDPIEGDWSQPTAYRTLVHEWAHHALFLYDEYRGASEGSLGGAYCTCPELPSGGCSNDASAMAYHYSASEFWSASIHGSPPLCERSDQGRFHGESDWETLARWSAIQGLPTEWLRVPGNSLNPGPGAGLAGDLFGREPDHTTAYLPLIQQGQAASALPSNPVSPSLASAQEPRLRLVATGTFTSELLNAFYPQVYLFQPATPAGPPRLIYQGTTNGARNTLNGHLGEITLFGVYPQSQLKIFADRYGTINSRGGRFSYKQGVGNLPPLFDGQRLALEPDGWQATLDINYEMTGARLTTMTLVLTSPTPLPAPPTAQLCLPDADTGCPAAPDWRKAMQLDNTMAWTATFRAPAGGQLPDYSLLWIAAPGRGDLIRWFQQAGGVGPGHKGAHAPMRDGPAMLNLISSLPLEGQRNRLIIMPAANYQALTAPLPPTIEGLIDMPLDLDVLLPPANPGTANVEVTLFHRPNSAQPVPANNCHLKILYFNPQLNQWEIVSPTDHNDQLNWANATAPFNQAGIYATAWSNDPCN